MAISSSAVGKQERLSSGSLSKREVGLVAAALLLPMPLLVLSGLTIPLPGVVERGLGSLIAGGAQHRVAVPTHGVATAGVPRSDPPADGRSEPTRPAPVAASRGGSSATSARIVSVDASPARSPQPPGSPGPRVGGDGPGIGPAAVPGGGNATPSGGSASSGGGPTGGAEVQRPTVHASVSAGGGAAAVSAGDGEASAGASVNVDGVGVGVGVGVDGSGAANRDGQLSVGATASDGTTAGVDVSLPAPDISTQGVAGSLTQIGITGGP